MYTLGKNISFKLLNFTVSSSLAYLSQQILNHLHTVPPTGQLQIPAESASPWLLRILLQKVQALQMLQLDLCFPNPRKSCAAWTATETACLHFLALASMPALCAPNNAPV